MVILEEMKHVYSNCPGLVLSVKRFINFRSDYFRAMLFGGLKESSLTEIELKDTPLAAFKQLLRYIYTGQVLLALFLV
jgi:hypothetical protein